MFSNLTILTINEIRNTKGNNAKMAVLTEAIGKDREDGSELHSILTDTYNPYIRYGISLKTYESLDAKDPKFVDIKITREADGLEGKALIGYINELLANENINNSKLAQLAHIKSRFNPVVQDILGGWLTKDLRLGMGTTQLNKCGLSIFTFDVQLSFAFEKYPLKPNEKFILMKKVNGVRAVMINGTLLSRQGHEYTNLENCGILKALGQLNKQYVFDGELELRNELKGPDDNINFREAVSAAKKGEWHKLVYTIFDIIYNNVFFSGGESAPFQDRMTQLTLMGGDGVFSSECLQLVDYYYSGVDQSEIDRVMQEVIIPNGFEGLMIARANSLYELKRTRGVLKYKQFDTMDLAIIGFTEGTGRNKDLLGNVIVDFDGNEVGVGSGFNDAMRKEIWENKDKYLGRVIEVQYKEISHDVEKGTKSLQFPTFKCVRELGKEPSTD